MPCTMRWCSVFQHRHRYDRTSPVLCSPEVSWKAEFISRYVQVLYCAVLCCAVLCCAVLCCAVLYCTVLCCTVLYCTVLYCTVPYFTLLLFTATYLHYSLHFCMCLTLPSSSFFNICVLQTSFEVSIPTGEIPRHWHCHWHWGHGALLHHNRFRAYFIHKHGGILRYFESLCNRTWNWECVTHFKTQQNSSRQACIHTSTTCERQRQI